jgi:hypothetical protein
MGAPDPAAASDRHLDHVRGFLQLLELHRTGDESVRAQRPPPSLYIGREAEGEPEFTELIGFRLRGDDSIQLGMVTFRRQGGGGPHARRSIGSYLARPPKRLAMEGVSAPANLLEVSVPARGESIPRFLDRVRKGDQPRRLHLDVRLIDFAFDFRMDNPSPEKQLEVHRKPLGQHVLRTVAGHLVSGRSLGLMGQLHRGIDFFMVTDTVQHLPDRDIPLPSLAINRLFVSVETEIEEGDTLEGWIRETHILDRSRASDRHLLDI